MLCPSSRTYSCFPYFIVKEPALVAGPGPDAEDQIEECGSRTPTEQIPTGERERGPQRIARCHGQREVQGDVGGEPERLAAQAERQRLGERFGELGDELHA